jgi:thymidylate synthase (FAD)
VSARYTELPAEFYVPEVWRKQDTKNKQGSDGVFSDDDNQALSERLSNFCEESYGYYQSLIDSGVSREMARMVLPVNIYTEIYVNCDLRNLLNFVRLREDSHAQYEIQVYGKAIKSVLEELYPMTMRAYDKYKFKMIES